MAIIAACAMPLPSAGVNRQCLLIEGKKAATLPAQRRSHTLPWATGHQGDPVRSAQRRFLGAGSNKRT
jgi:hypothetical protein